MMALLSGPLLYVIGGVIILGLATWAIMALKHSGVEEQKAKDVKEELDAANTRIKVDAEVAAESSASVADDLRKQRNQ